MSSSRERQRLLDIIDNIDAISRYVSGMDLDQFVADAKTVDATERCLERIIEATVKIGKERMAVIAPDLPVDAVRGLGNVLRHEYDRIDLAFLFATISNRLPPLRAACIAALGDAS